MRPVFKLPGRSSIDALTSWIGDGTIGVLLTSKQYEEGYYTKKEAAIIGTTFSVVSITFSIVIIDKSDLARTSLPFYGTVRVNRTCSRFHYAAHLSACRAKKRSILTEDRLRAMKKNYLKAIMSLSHGLENALETANNKSFVRKSCHRRHEKCP